jgi:hypothetical protein
LHKNSDRTTHKYLYVPEYAMLNKKEPTHLVVN